MFSGFKIKQPEFKCGGSYPIARMCINSDCKESSLVCNNLDCGKCGKNHKSCTQIALSYITDKLQVRLLKQKEFIQNVCNIENEFIKEIHKSTRNLLK